jgi:hypothetical protein
MSSFCFEKISSYATGFITNSPRSTGSTFSNPPARYTSKLPKNGPRLRRNQIDGGNSASSAISAVAVDLIIVKDSHKNSA